MSTPETAEPLFMGGHLHMAPLRRQGNGTLDRLQVPAQPPVPCGSKPLQVDVGGVDQGQQRLSAAICAAPSAKTMKFLWLEIVGYQLWHVCRTTSNRSRVYCSRLLMPPF